jgi:putative transposase
MRRICRILGFRRQTYYQRRQEYRAENTTQELAKCLHQAAEEFVSWGFWKIFHYLRNSGLQDNHKRVYRVWKKEGLHLRRPPKRERIYRQYKDLRFDIWAECHKSAAFANWIINNPKPIYQRL